MRELFKTKPNKDTKSFIVVKSKLTGQYLASKNTAVNDIKKARHYKSENIAKNAIRTMGYTNISNLEFVEVNQ